MNQKTKERKIYIDFLKIIAIFLVLFNHTNDNGFVLFTVKQNSPFFLVYLFIAIFTKIAVPLFFMTSGAVMIGKNEPIKDIIKKRVLKYLFILVICSMLQYLYSCYIAYPKPFSFLTFITRLYTSQLAGAYWYLYAYLAYLFMLPLLRRLGQAMKEKEFLWMLLMFACINVLPIIDFLLWKGSNYHNGQFSFFININYVFYPLMGYYIDQVVSEKIQSWKTMLILVCVSIISIVICSYMTIYRCNLIGEWKESSCQTFFGTLIFAPTITVFFMVKMIFIKHKPGEKVSNYISAIGGTTFGIFLFEEIYRRETKGILSILEPYIKTFPACLAWIFTAFCVGIIVTLILKKIPGVKKYI